MALARLPKELPGRFFVLQWDRDAEVFRLFLDDLDNSNYNLGGDIPKVMMRMRVWGIEDLGNRTIDLAKEFGSAQCIFTQNRVIALFDRKAPNKLKLKWEDYGDDIPIKNICTPRLK